MNQPISIDNLYMIIPTWFSDQVDDNDVRNMLRTNLTGSERYILPEHHYIYLDGIPKFESFIKKGSIERLVGKEGKGKGLLIRKRRV